MHYPKIGILSAISLVFALSLGAAPQQSEAAGVCQKVRGVSNKGCVRTRDLRKGTVRAKHIKTGAVTANKLTAAALAGGRRPVEDCGTIDRPGNYVLVNDLPGPLGLNLDGGCLVIEADDVTLDLAGFSIVGDGTGDDQRGDGVSIEGRSNVTIRNGTVRDFVDDGIDGNGDQARNNRVSDIRATGNRGSGINLSGSDHQVTNCLATANDADGIDVNSSATLTGNTANGNDKNGIDTQSGSGVAGNIAKGNTGFGNAPGSNSAVAGNVATGNADAFETCNTCAFAANIPPRARALNPPRRTKRQGDKSS